jgi:hypothetical protein
MSDRLQSLGTWSISGNRGKVEWTMPYNGKTVWLSSHRNSAGIPAGSEFLYEDGHVSWRVFKLNNPRTTIDVGSISGQWVLFYKPPNIITNM